MTRTILIQNLSSLISGQRCRFVVLASESGGRCSRETAEFIRRLVVTNAQSSPAYLRIGAAVANQNRWTRTMFGVIAANAFADSLLMGDGSSAGALRTVGRQPWLQGRGYRIW